MGGAEKQLVIWAELLQVNLGMQVAVATFDSRIDRKEVLDELQVPVLVLGQDLSTAARTRKLLSFAHAMQPDVVHAFTLYLAPLAYMSALACRAVPVAATQGNGSSDMQELRTIFRSPTMKAIKYFTCNSHEALAHIKPHVRSNALLYYVPNLVAVPKIEFPTTHEKSNKELSNKHLVVLSVGRLDDNKRVDVYLQALARARREEPRLTGVVVGDGPLRAELTKQAESLGLLPDGVVFMGQLSDPDPAYAAADIFVHLAQNEGTPNVLLEAMAAGLPVVTTAAGDIPHIVRTKENGIIVPFNDPGVVAKQILLLAKSRELRHSLGEQAHKDVLHSFSAKKVSYSLERFYLTIKK